MRGTPHRDIELMPQIQVLDFKPAPRPESVANESNEQMNQGKHRDRECADSLSYCQAVRTAFSGGTGHEFHEGRAQKRQGFQV
jgi:hypothetical protein